MPKRVRKPGRRWTQCRRRRCPVWEERVPVPRNTRPILQKTKTRPTVSTNRAHVADRCGDYHWVCSSATVCQSYWGPPRQRGAASKRVAVWTRVDWSHTTSCATAFNNDRVRRRKHAYDVCERHVACRQTTRPGVIVVCSRAMGARSGDVLYALTLFRLESSKTTVNYCPSKV